MIEMGRSKMKEQWNQFRTSNSMTKIFAVRVFNDLFSTVE